MSIYGGNRYWFHELSRTKPDGSTDKPEDETHTVGPDYTADTGDDTGGAPDNTPPEPDDSTDTEGADTTDYTLDDPDVGGAEPAENDDNAPSGTDYTETDDEDDDNAPPVGEADPDDPASANTDYTIPDDDDPEANDDGTGDSIDGNDDVGDDNDEPPAGTDYTADADDSDNAPPDTGGGDTTATPDSGDGGEPSGSTDYTADTGDADAEPADDTEDGIADPDTEGDVEGQEDNTTGNELKQLEDEIFSSLTPEQIAIREEELKKQFIDLYDTTVQVTERIKSINKTLDNAKELEFVSIKLLELKDQIYHIVTKAYNTKTYIENATLYQQCLSVLSSIQKLLVEITPKPLENGDQNNK